MAERRKPTVTLGERVLERWGVIAGLATVLILGLTYLFLIRPTLEKTGPGGAVDVRALDRAATTAEAAAAAEQSLLREYQSLPRETRLKIDAAVPRGPTIPSLIAVVDGLTRQAGLVPAAIDVTIPREGLRGAPDIGVLQIALNAGGGDYASLKRLLTSLEHNLRITDVLALTYNPLTASYSLSARAYFLKTPSAPGPVPASP